jgi:hypothetical protein
MSLALIFPLPSAKLAQHVPIDILSYERTAVAFQSAGALIHLAVRTLRLDRAFKGMLQGIF